MSESPSKPPGAPAAASSRPARSTNGGHRKAPYVRKRPPREVDAAPADPERVQKALDRAIEAAETGRPESPVILVRPEDLELFAPLELRPSLDEVLCGRHADAGLDSLLDTGVLDALLPEVDALVGFGDGEWRHKDVWKHTKQVVIQAVPKLELRWAALLHDIGKVRTRTISENGEVHFFGHAEVGARMFDKMERRLSLFETDRDLRAEVRFLILHHLRAGCYESSWTDSAVRRFAREMGEHLDHLLLLSRADMTTKRPEKRRRAMRMISELAARIEELRREDARVPPLPKGLGLHLMKEFHIPPSKLLGDLIRVLEAAADAGEIESGRDSAYYVSVVAKDPARFGISA